MCPSNKLKLADDGDTQKLIKLIRNILLKENKFLFFKKINSNKAFNHDEIDVAIGIMIKPISLK